MNQKRPVNLALTTLKYPPMAIVSILHRISGLMLFLLMPFMLYLLALSLKNADSFDRLQDACCKLLLWAFGAALLLHLIAGIRHLLMDMGFGEQLEAGRRSAVAVMVLAAVLIILLGIRIW